MTSKAPCEGPLDEQSREVALGIVRCALGEAVARGETTPLRPAWIVESVGVVPAVFGEFLGAFVSLHDSEGGLRGCIGNIVPYASLLETLWGRAQDAALNDPRFAPVSVRECVSLQVEVSVLTPPREIDTRDEIVLGRHGIILQKLGRSAVFLPQVPPEQGWDLGQTLTALSRKAGLSGNAWHDGAVLKVFEAQVFGGPAQ
ncbi:MAG: AmmeMemoRadiSam system protein A [Proteobacteria bacterium]|nr:AmmeMemoRadiSam system protein A [Pseudomonadota bacterium]